MSVRQLYELQVLELDISSAEQSAAQAQARLNDSEELRLAQLKLTTARGGLDALASQQKLNEWAVADITAKMTVTSESLYGGRVRNPKELTDLQHELDALTRQRNPLEEKALSYMEKIESAQAGLAKLADELKTVEERLREEHQALHAQLEEIKARLVALHEQHAARIALIPPEEVKFYTDLKKRRGAPVARVEKGTCACRISLSSAELQRARAGKIIQCSSCSRILFIE